MLEGMRDRLLRPRRARRLRLPARRVQVPGRDSRQGDRRGLRGRDPRQEHARLAASSSTSTSAPRRRRVHLRRGDGAARVPRGQEGLAAAQAAVPGGGRACSAARPWSTTSRRWPRALHHRDGRREYAALGTERVGGTRLVALSGHVNKPGVYEMRDEDHAAGDRSTTSAAASPAGASSRRSSPAARRARSSPAERASTSPWSSRPSRTRARWPARAASSPWTTPPAWCARSGASRGSTPRSRCGQCTPCREGTPWMTRLLRKIEEGRGQPEDINMLLR